MSSVTVYSRHHSLCLVNGERVHFSPTEMEDIFMAKVGELDAVHFESVPGCANRSLEALDGLSERERNADTLELITPTIELGAEEVELEPIEPKAPGDLQDSPAPKPKNKGGRPPRQKPLAEVDS